MRKQNPTVNDKPQAPQISSADAKECDEHSRGFVIQEENKDAPTSMLEQSRN